MVAGTASVPPAPKLGGPTSELCVAYLQGICPKRRGECNKSHEVVLPGTDQPRPRLDVREPNVLSSEPRVLHKDPTKAFDLVGPGLLAPSGPRHDNDHVDIGDIAILPTTDEILCRKAQYLPRHYSADQPSHLPFGPKLLCDIQFRQLRYENIEPVVDCCYNGFQMASTMLDESCASKLKLETACGNHYNLFTLVEFEELAFDEYQGLIVRLSYDCPKRLRGRAMNTAKILEHGKLCTLLAVHEDGTLNTVMFNVFLRQSTEAMRSKTRASVQLSLAEKDDIVKVREALYYSQSLINSKFFLVDFPDVLTAGFVDHLRVLQNLSVTGDFAFSEQIAPKDPKAPITVGAPADLSPDFKYDLNCLAASGSEPNDPELFMSIQRTENLEEKSATVDKLKKLTTLDDGQAVALYDSLNRGLSFTQGPPGTGKTFLGVAEAQVLLNSRVEDDHRPIIVVTQTNHSLDDTIAGLLKRGITRIARFGSRSVQPWIAPYLMTNLRSKVKSSCADRTKTWQARNGADTLHRQGCDWTAALTGDELGYGAIQDYLETNHPKIAAHFASLERSDYSTNDLRRLKNWRGFAYEYWISNGDLTDVSSLIESLSTLLGETDLPEGSVGDYTMKAKVLSEIKQNVDNSINTGDLDIWKLDLNGRQNLVAEWVSKMDRWELCEKLAEIHRRYHKTVCRKREVFSGVDKRVIDELKTDIIGMTSTACARNWELLKAIEPRAIIFEEASELLQAHSICSLVPTIKHAIQIGDPRQLRPHLSEMVLSMENEPRFRLDESLFERLMKHLPFSKLNVQRRAHPDMADLLRVGDYPFLVDDPSTKSFPDVPGLPKRMFFVNHDHPEDSPDPRSPNAKSHSNSFEVEFVAKFVKFMIERQGVTMNKITVLTPYNGQLAALTKRLGEDCTVQLTKEDRETLIDQGLLEDVPNSEQNASLKLNDMIRVATIDNYQGEENDIVVFSSVRNNKSFKIGFVENENRKNVAISRAHNGFYVFGNADLMKRSDPWKKVIGVFESKGIIGSALPTKPCARHQKKTHLVRGADDFEKVPECTEPCLGKLPCGHDCFAACHPIEMHSDGRTQCTQKCSKSLTCGHDCQSGCGATCGPCTKPLKAIELPCGHEVHPLCSQRNTEIECPLALSRTKLACGHEKIVRCSKSYLKDVCEEKCEHELGCGHNCPGCCGQCTMSGGHAECTSKCSKERDCGHRCAKICHQGPCPPCEEPCEKRCKHAKCKLPCHVVCDPCVKTEQVPACEHSSEDLTRLCCLPSSKIPCAAKCNKFLSCGLHVCPSLCSEVCPHKCLQCEGIHEDQATITLACQHTYAVKFLDAAFKMKDFYEVDAEASPTKISIKRIPTSKEFRCLVCSASSIESPRYNLVNKLASIQETIDRLYAKCGRHLDNGVRHMKEAEYLLFANFDSFCKQLKPGPLSGQRNHTIIKQRGGHTYEMQKEACRFRDEVVIPMEECIKELSKVLGNSELFPVPNLQFKLRFDRIYFRCRYMMIEFGLRVCEHLKKLPDSDHHTAILLKGLSLMIEDQALGELKTVEARITECADKNLKRLEAEMHIVKLCFSASLLALGTGSCLDVEKSFSRLGELCNSFPETAGRLQFNVPALRRSIDAKCVSTRLDDIYDASAAELLAKWADHEIGHLSHCQWGHPYSSQGFPDGCPECGNEREVRPGKWAGLQYKKTLPSPEEFLKAFHLN